MKGLVAGLAIAVAVACNARPVPSETTPEVPGPPSIATVDLACDVDAARWTLEVETTAWVGGATSDWTVNGRYIERHSLDGVRFEADGTGEVLRVVNTIVADFRKQGRGRTAFVCADDVDVLLEITDLEGNRVDCRAIGPDPTRWQALSEGGGCGVVWPDPPP